MKQCPQCYKSYGDNDLYCYDDGNHLARVDQLSAETPTVFVPMAKEIRGPSNIGSTQSKWVFPLVGILLGTVIVMAFLLMREGESNESATTNRGQETPATVTSDGKPSNDSSTIASSAPRNSPANKNASPAYPAIYRLKFAKGAVATSFPGQIISGDSRRFVLACRAGQELSATITSESNCVVFDNSAVSHFAITTKGDNYLTIMNNCSSDTGFRISVTII